MLLRPRGITEAGVDAGQGLVYVHGRRFGRVRREAGLQIAQGLAVAAGLRQGRTAQPQGGRVVGEAFEHLLGRGVQAVGVFFELYDQPGHLGDGPFRSGPDRGPDDLLGVLHPFLGDHRAGV